MRRASEAAKRAVQFLALLLAVLAGAPAIAAHDDRAAAPTILAANFDPGLNRSDAPPVDLRPTLSGDQQADGDGPSGDDPSDHPASARVFPRPLSDGPIVPAGADAFAGRSPGIHRARAPPLP